MAMGSLERIRTWMKIAPAQSSFSSVTVSPCNSAAQTLQIYPFVIFLVTSVYDYLLHLAQTFIGPITGVSSTRGKRWHDIALVENLITSYIKTPSYIILLTVACEKYVFAKSTLQPASLLSSSSSRLQKSRRISPH